MKEYTHKKRVLYDPLTDEFAKYGDKFEKIARNEANGMYCYKRTTPDGLAYYEVFKAPKRICKDGIKHECYPQTAEFGFGTALCLRGDEGAHGRQNRLLYGQRIQCRAVETWLIERATPKDHPCHPNKDNDFSGTMTRKAKGHPVTADYTVWTVELNREELMIILNGIRNHRINRAKLTLQNMRARRDRGSKQTKHVKNNTR